ncbi:response regulator transcription factor [Nocardioides sp. HDW12B]|uniref:response regulator transcription factor n=1 Tax=Nocardioides sp. HDW12B TaxID=2714939 RepID=UPI001408A384|nr:response regulator transcription factor [Nocardioides sp. HDW12B]QIK67227.1 response regulator transcription factor [Nocardioides sp. HDW12B]
MSDGDAPASAGGPTGTTGEEDVRPPVRVLVVDDHEVLSGSLALVVGAEADMEAVGVARDLAEARRQVVEHQPDVILLDRRLPDGDGIEAIGELRTLSPASKVVVLTASDTDQVLVQAIEAGASGFLSKSRGLGEVIGAVRAAAAGEAVISGEMLSRLLPKLTRSSGPTVELTPREQDVLELLAEGKSNAAIAADLFVSVHTVRNHVANLSAKLGAHSKLEALSIAVRRGLLPDA